MNYFVVLILSLFFLNPLLFSQDWVERDKASNKLFDSIWENNENIRNSVLNQIEQKTLDINAIHDSSLFSKPKFCYPLISKKTEITKQEFLNLTVDDKLICVLILYKEIIIYISLWEFKKNNWTVNVSNYNRFIDDGLVYEFFKQNFSNKIFFTERYTTDGPYGFWVVKNNDIIFFDIDTKKQYSFNDQKTIKWNDYDH